MTDTLVLLHVIFRHGDRTPVKTSIYPKDPHKDYDYFPYGYGQLTNVGKRRAYRLGHTLRQRYGEFLEDFYKAEDLDAWASDSDRTKMTLQLVLASLYTPKNEQIWHDHILWQPIPYNCTPKKYDQIFLPSHFNQIALAEYNDYVKGAGKEIMESYKNLIDYMEQHTGSKINSPRYIFNLANTLSIQENMGLELPKWTKEVWPHRMQEIAMKEFEFMSATPRLISLVAGKLLQKIVEDSMLKIKGQSQHKAHLYSGHDYTICIFLKALNVFDYRHPDFCSNVAIELHKIDGVYGYMIKYQQSENEDVKLLEIPNVGTFWPIDDFMEHNRYILEEKPYDLPNSS